MGPAALIFHKISYAGIFEEGGTINGNPVLWIILLAAQVAISRAMLADTTARPDNDFTDRPPWPLSC